MREVLLDTNFIIACLKQKIDFIEEFNLLGYKVLIPEQVINELKRNKQELALNFLEKQKNFFRTIDIGKGHVDKKIIQYSKKNPEIVVATLDKELKNSLKNKKAIIREKKRIIIL